MAHVGQKFTLGAGRSLRSLFGGAQVTGMFADQGEQAPLCGLHAPDAYRIDRDSNEDATQGRDGYEPHGPIKNRLQGHGITYALVVPNPVIIGRHYPQAIRSR